MKSYTLYEVWGDTIDRRHLARSIVIGAVVSLGCYGLAKWILSSVVGNAQMAHAYSMLGGIVGCLLGGIICALLHEPKRTVSEQVADESFRQQVLVDLQKQYGSIGRLADVQPEVIAELKELGLYELFRSYEEAQDAAARDADSAAPAASIPTDSHGHGLGVPLHTQAAHGGAAR